MAECEPRHSPVERLPVCPLLCPDQRRDSLDQTHIGTQTADSRFITLLLDLFAGLGTILAVGGAHGMVAYLVAQRTPELAVRLAVGASSDILRLVLRYGVSIGLAGIALGLGGALAERRRCCSWSLPQPARFRRGAPRGSISSRLRIE